MAKLIDVGVEEDHIESLTKSNGINALSELIWNSLDADSTEIHIEIEQNPLAIEKIIIRDNGTGLDYDKAQDVFARLGGSEKKKNNFSKGGRSFHGKEGKGRYKSLALGDLVTFKSKFKKNNDLYKFDVVFDRNKLSNSSLSDLEKLSESNQSTGFYVEILNINQENALQALDEKNREEIAQKFTTYWLNYPDFNIYIDGKNLDFKSLVKNKAEMETTALKEDLTYRFNIKVLEWNFDIKKKTYLCNSTGSPFKELKLGIRSPIPISIFIHSAYIEKLHRENLLDLSDSDEILLVIINDAKKFAKEYVRKRLHYYSYEFINELKNKGLYPYKDKPESIIEESKRQVFDIVALQINEFLPDFENHDDKSKKFTLSLIKEALENDSFSLQRILTEVIELPISKREELVEILEVSSLSNIIDTMTEIKNRLRLINALEELIHDKNLNANVLERKHLHKIIVEETWIFGDEYTYGVDDVTLKNVLKEYIKHLGREDFIQILESQPNHELQIIPDVCLWKQFPTGRPGYKTNLVIELKKPSLNAGTIELNQIKQYAQIVSKDKRFPKEKTKWKFLLITKDFKPEIEIDLEQNDREYGHIISNEYIDVHVLSWGQIFNEAKSRLEFIKERLNINFMDNEENLNYLKTKYKEYLPNNGE